MHGVTRTRSAGRTGTQDRTYGDKRATLDGGYREMEERTFEKVALDEIIGSALTRVGIFIWRKIGC
jgi:hypothetical protein